MGRQRQYRSNAARQRAYRRRRKGLPPRRDVITTARVGTNADLVADIFALYVPVGSKIGDVTYGKGTFWRKIDQAKYTVLATDIQTGTDFRSLPYEPSSLDALILDPPYMHDGAGVHSALNENYRNRENPVGSHAEVMRLYADGLREAARVLRRKGVVIAKCQDEIESGRQRFSHIEIFDILHRCGFKVIDLFVLVQKGCPILRFPYQKSARKNHSYAWIGKRK